MYAFSSVEIDVEIDKVCKSEDVEETKHAFCLNFCSSMALYMIRVLDFSTSLKITCHFCSMYTFSSTEINTKFDKICRSEDVEETKHAFCSNSCSSMMPNMIRVLDFSTSLKINCYFFSTYTFFSVEIHAEIVEFKTRCMSNPKR
jgi:hypothetical protein